MYCSVSLKAFFMAALLLLMASPMHATNPNQDFNCQDETSCTEDFTVHKGNTTITMECYGVKVHDIDYKPPPQLELSCKSKNASVSCIVGGKDGCDCNHDANNPQTVTAKIKNCCVRNGSCKEN